MKSNYYKLDFFKNTSTTTFLKKMDLAAQLAALENQLAQAQQKPPVSSTVLFDATDYFNLTSDAPPPANPPAVQPSVDQSPNDVAQELAKLEAQLAAAKAKQNTTNIEKKELTIAEQLAQLEAKLIVAKTLEAGDESRHYRSNTQVEVKDRPHVAVHQQINHSNYGKYQEAKYTANAHIIGQVTRIVPGKFNETKDFYIYSQRTQKEYHCQADFFLPIEVNDIIDGPVYVEGGPKRMLVYFLKQHKPFVEMSFNRDAIIQVIIKILRGKGVGEKRASQLYDFLDRITNHQNRVASYLSEIALLYEQTSSKDYIDIFAGGVLNEKQAQILLTQWFKKRDLRRLYLLGLSNSDIRNIQMPPDKIYEQCLKNPYVIYQLKREKADIIAKQLRLPLHNDDIICGQMVRHIHATMTNNSWTCIPVNSMIRYFPDFPRVKEKLADEYKVVIDFNSCYLYYPFHVESDFANNVIKMLQREDNYIMKDPHFKSDLLDDHQKEAVSEALLKPVSQIIGGPGTGKTTIIGEIIHNLELHEIPYLVVSFTGKAVARVKEVVATIPASQASTIHLTLAKGYKQKGRPMYIIVDEASMVTINLLYKLCKMFQFDFQLIMVGDINQLPPIGWGAVFQQCVFSQKIPVYELKTNHRSMLENNIPNGIIYNAVSLIAHLNEVKQLSSNQVALPYSFKEMSNFLLYDGNIDMVYDIVRGLSNQGSEAKQITIVTPYRRYLQELNCTCQSIFNDGNKYTESGNITWMIGDRVMMRKNNYDIYVMNGEEGIITDINSQYIKVKFSSGAEHSFKLLPEDIIFDPYDNKGDKDDNDEQNKFNNKGKDLTIEYLCHCFALSIHRSQGSEWDYIIVYIPGMNNSNGASFLDYRLIYTAFTRAKKMVWIVGDLDTLNSAANNLGKMRFDNLAKRINHEYMANLSRSNLPVTESANIHNMPKNITNTEHGSQNSFD